MATGKEIVPTGSSLEARNLMQSIAAVELYRSQIEVAKFLELAYVGVSDHPDVAKEVRLTAHSARIQHMMTTGLMKSLMLTAKNIVGTLIPMIFDAVGLQDKDLVRDCFAMIITKAEEMKTEAAATKAEYFAIQSMVQVNLAEVNKKNKSVRDTQKILYIEKDVAKKLAAEHKRAAKELEKEKDKMENDLKNLEAYRDNCMVELETAKKAMKEEKSGTFLDAVIGSSDAAAALGGLAKNGLMRGFNIISSVFGGKSKADEEQQDKELEEEKDKMENDLKNLNRDNCMVETETENKVMKEENSGTFLDAVIGSPDAAAGLGGLANNGLMMGINVISSVFGQKGKADKVKQFKNIMQAYQQSQDNVVKISAEKREVLSKMQAERRAKHERLAKIKELNVEKANLGDAESLLEASSRLSEVDEQFAKIITFWDNMAKTLKLLKDKTEYGEVYLRNLEDPRYAERFNSSITRAEEGWNGFGKICEDYVFASENDERIGIKVLYKFLTTSIDEISEHERNNRMRAIEDEIEENIDFEEDENE